MKELGEVNHFLEVEINHTLDGLFQCQEKYARDLLLKYEMIGSKHRALPIDIDSKFSKLEGKDLEDYVQTDS